MASPNEPQGQPPAQPPAQGGGRGQGPAPAQPQAQGGGRGQAPPPPPADPKYHWAAPHSSIGTHVKRLDGPDKVTGRAKYTFDINRPGMLYGKIVRSPHPRARIVSVDLTPAQKAPGVKATLLWRDPADTARSIVMYQGDEIAAVAADTEEHATDAARLVKVEYEVLPAVIQVDQALAGNAPAVFAASGPAADNTPGTPRSNVRQGQTQETGDIAAGFKQAAQTLEETYSTHVITHVCLESHGAVCEWDGDNLTAWVSTQGVNATKDGFATGLKIPASNVRVITQYMGGGFGSKLGAQDPQSMICARLAKQANAPVKLMLDRKEEHLATGNRPSAAARIKVGVTADGMITAFDAESWGTGGAGAAAGFPLPYIYQIPNRRRTHKDVFINTGLQRPMRAPGHPQGSFITEVMMEELADRVKMDPVEFRIKNLPPEAPNAMWGSYLRQGAKEFGWDKRHPTGDPAPGPIKTGMGVAINTWGGGGSQGRAHVEISSDGTVVVRCGTQDLGTGTRTLVAVVAADTFGIPVSNIKPEIGDTVYPVSGGSGGSTTAAGISPAIRIATVNALDALKEKIAPALGVEPASLVAANGRIQVKDNPSKGMSWAEACKQIGPQPLAADGAWQPGLSSVTTSGVQFAEVKVDIETGIVKVTRILALQDCGLVVSRLTAESQVYGGVVGSLNFALFEDRILDRNTGQMVNPNMEWYLLAGMSDIPKIDVRLIDQSERGVIGIGEPPTVPTAAAVALAVRNAIGVTVRSLPLTPAKILQTLAQRRA
ncbi:MAG TPA: xanthine dehydrogenase family protein molybdopterin-binding subunit [Vicinamibacterales bacterium]|nr:xanthine dehydrogenase family protein molybdopterin-binding subunit [Vicinamibacterales bacterium]